MVKPRLLVTRFAPHAQRLAAQLNTQGIFAVAQPLMTVSRSAEFDNAHFIFTTFFDYIIAVSCNAVSYTNQALAGVHWPISHYLAVGQSTQEKLQTVTGQTVLVPAEQFSSEGLLALPCLKNLAAKRVLILRGVGGRELLAQQLTARGAKVDYYQPYQRTTVNLPGSLLVKQWQRLDINGAIISSGELLESLLALVPEAHLSWAKGLTIYLPSERLAEQARLSGFNRVQLIPGVQDKQILDYFT